MGGLTIAVIALSALALALGLALFFERRAIRRLSRGIEDFLVDGGETLPFSVRENALAPLHNAAAELENQLCLAREKRREELRRTAGLIADISHQLKTPLASLKLYCEMDGAPHAREEIAQAERMERLIYSLLRLERLCADGYAFEYKPCDAAIIVREAWRSLSPLYPDKRFSLSGAATLRGDEKWLGEAFLNILKNACEHTAPDGHVWASVENLDGAFFAVFEDDGGGVPKKDLPRLFERFYRADARESKGAGIGLAITREIARRHHGSVSAKNTPRGLRVTVCIPPLNERLVRT